MLAAAKLLLCAVGGCLKKKQINLGGQRRGLTRSRQEITVYILGGEVVGEGVFGERPSFCGVQPFHSLEWGRQTAAQA